MRRNKKLKRGYRRPRNRNRANESSITRIQSMFTKTFAYSAAITQNNIEINMNNTTGLTQSGNRLSQIYLAFAEFRVTRVCATIYPYNDTTTTDNIFCIAYMPGIDQSDAPDTFTFAQICDVSTRALVPAKKTMPTTLRIGRDVMLSAPYKWYPCVTSSTDNDETQGAIIIKPRDSSTCSLTVNLSVVIEFRIPTVQGLSGLIVVPSLAHDKEEVVSDSEDFKIVKIYKNKNEIGTSSSQISRLG